MLADTYQRFRLEGLPFGMKNFCGARLRRRRPEGDEDE